MELPKLLLMDLRNDKTDPFVSTDLSDYCKLYSLVELERLNDMVNITKPDVICFDFDYPDNRCLQALEKTKHLFPSIPILMCTEYHDEQLAVWALRARVWDYLIKPLESVELLRTLRILSDLRMVKEDRRSSRNIIRPRQIISECKIQQNKASNKCTTFNVVRYVESHYHEKIYISELADQCRISQHQFGRVFKREKGITFREYLVCYRLDKARELLKESELPVGDVGFAVGFSDHSYFTRMFRRHVGLCPSDYRMRHQ